MTAKVEKASAGSESESTGAPQARGGSKIANVALVGIALASIAVALVLVFGDLPKQGIGALTIVLMLMLMLLRLPIGIAMIVAGSIGLFGLTNIKAVVGTAEQVVFGSMASWQLSVIPMFVLMGVAMWKGGLTTKAFVAARQWLGHLPGGLAVATNFAGAGMAAGSGSTIGISFALGKIAIPEMLRSGYKPSLATGTVAAVGTLGQLIPPSVMIVLYAGIAQTPVGPQLIAAIVPGILLALAFGAMILIRAMITPNLAPKVVDPSITWKTRWASLVGIAPIGFIVLVVIGGIFLGVFTATEAGAVGAVVTVIMSIFGLPRGERTLRNIGRMLLDTMKSTVVSTASILLLVIGVNFLTRIMALSGLAQDFARAVRDADLSPFAFLAVLILLYLVLGMFLDSLAMMLLTVPLLLGPLGELGIDPLWFGVFVVIMAEIGILSPPVGILSFIVHGLAQDPQVNLGQRIGLTTVFRGVMPFILVCLLLVLVLILFPDLVLWLPSLSAAG